MTRMDTYLAPAQLCRQHLLANHHEAHQLAGYARNGHVRKLLGHAARGQIDMTRLREWHDACAAELRRRGYAHDSPLAFDLALPIGAGAIGRATTRRLDRRCGECRERMGSQKEDLEESHE